MRSFFFCVVMISFASCCKYRVTPAAITFRFEGFDPAMSQVTVVAIRGNGYVDSTILPLDGNKQTLYRLPNDQIDSIYLFGLIPSGTISLHSLNTSILGDGSGACGGPPDEGMVSFAYKDSTYFLARHHFVRIHP